MHNSLPDDGGASVDSASICDGHCYSEIETIRGLPISQELLWRKKLGLIIYHQDVAKARGITG